MLRKISAKSKDSDSELTDINQPLLLGDGNAPQAMRDSLNLTDLPGDVLYHIAFHLAPHDIAALSATSRRLHQQIIKGKASAVWQAKLAQHFPQAVFKFTNQRVQQADFAVAYQKYYGRFNARTRWLFTLAAEGDVIGLAEGRPLYTQSRRRWFSFLGDPAKKAHASMSLDEMLQGHVRYYRSLSVVKIASRQLQQSILDHGYFLTQARFRGVGVESMSGSIGPDGRQLIHYAATMNQSADTICALLASGAGVNAERHSGKTPLHIAVENGNTRSVVALLANGATVNAMLQNGVTPLYHAVCNGHIKIVERLLAYGATVNTATQGGFTPLNIAIYKDHIAIAEQLLANDADANVVLQNGATPLYLAADKGHETIVRQLLTKDVDVNAATQDGMTPLFIAAFNGHAAIVDQLLTNGAAANARLQNGATPLYAAAQQGHTAIVEQLLANGAVVDVASQRANPLFIAALQGHLATVERLLANGAAVNTVLQSGEALLSIAIQAGHAEVALHLYAHVIQLRNDNDYMRYIPLLFGKRFTGFGKSAGEKKQAAQALLLVVKGKAGLEMLQPHAAALSNGRLGKIAKGLGYLKQWNGNVVHRLKR
tara:strand:+ start:342 stop:2138 length:1797 start_codon:yes stop_codon:yes gene_type:complete